VLRLSRARGSVRFGFLGVVVVLGAVALPRAAVASATDHPTSAIGSPSPGSLLTEGTPVVVSGVAANGEQGGITQVEVSANGGPWELADGTETWQFVYFAEAPGPVVLRSRASTADTVEEPTRSVTVTVGWGTPAPVSCPCRFLLPSLPDRPVLDEQDPLPVEVGLRFRTDRDGFVTGLGFYRHPENTGPQVGHLWSADGELLAEATLSGATGFVAQITFDRPVAVQAGATYTVSYFTPTGHYASSIDYFAGAVVRAPFEAVYDRNGTAGVYRYDGGFPDQTWNASNYWVWPVFTT